MPPSCSFVPLFLPLSFFFFLTFSFYLLCCFYLFALTFLSLYVFPSHLSSFPLPTLRLFLLFILFSIFSYSPSLLFFFLYISLIHLPFSLFFSFVSAFLVLSSHAFLFLYSVFLSPISSFPPRFCILLMPHSFLSKRRRITSLVRFLSRRLSQEYPSRQISVPP